MATPFRTRINYVPPVGEIQQNQVSETKPDQSYKMRDLLTKAQYGIITARGANNPVYNERHTIKDLNFYDLVEQDELRQQAHDKVENLKQTSTKLKQATAKVDDFIKTSSKKQQKDDQAPVE